MSSLSSQSSLSSSGSETKGERKLLSATTLAVELLMLLTREVKSSMARFSIVDILDARRVHASPVDSAHNLACRVLSKAKPSTEAANAEGGGRVRGRGRSW